jgi:hypothetical protein
MAVLLHGKISEDRKQKSEVGIQEADVRGQGDQLFVIFYWLLANC